MKDVPFTKGSGRWVDPLGSTYPANMTGSFRITLTDFTVQSFCKSADGVTLRSKKYSIKGEVTGTVTVTNQDAALSNKSLTSEEIK
jgi:hypothetical protein